MQRSFTHLVAFAFALTQSSIAIGSSDANEQDPKSQAAASARVPAPVELAVKPTPDVTRAELEAHVRFLASDELAGRFTGSPDADRAARYLALVLERQGVEPAGDGGGFLQDVPMSRTRPSKLSELRCTDRTGATSDAVFGRDFEAGDSNVTIDSAPVIVAASEEAIPREADRRSVLFVDAPASRRRQWLEKSGHPGGEGFAAILEAGSDKPGTPTTELPAASSPTRSRRTNEAEKPARIRVRGTLLERLRKGEIERITFASHVEQETVHGANVVGRIRGVSEEAVVLSAHYDHLDSHRAPAAASNAGAPVDVGADGIFNGADDDASGVAAVLEIAGALASGEKPELTIVILLATGEEVGLLGTREYLDRPVVPLAKTVANLNFEMIGRPDDLVGGVGKMWLTGHELTNLGPAWIAGGIDVKPDPRPDEHFFQRSDNYAFVVRGVVGQSFSTYNMHTDYHTPADEADRIDFAHMETCTKIALEAVRTVTDGAIRPAWLPGKEPKQR
jgi:hypothetical protein